MVEECQAEGGETLAEGQNTSGVGLPLVLHQHLLQGLHDGLYVIVVHAWWRGVDVVSVAVSR